MEKPKHEGGKFKKGVSGNPNGRPKGSKNKFTKEVKERMMKIIGKWMKNWDDDLEAMSPKDRVAAQNAFLKYFLATNARQKTKVSGKVQIDVKYSDEAKPDSETKED